MELAKQIELSSPFWKETVNCYALLDGELTLIDPGPATEQAYTELATALDEYDRSIENIERILITHPHMDHYGLASRLASESGAKVLSNVDAIERLGAPGKFFERRQKVLGSFLVSMGLPESLAKEVSGPPESSSGNIVPVNVNRGLADNETIDVGTALEVVQTPGHTQGALCFISSEYDVTFTGDHVMADFQSSPLLTLNPRDRSTRARSLPNYINSLNKLRPLAGTRGYGGHHGPISDVPARIDQILDHHNTRKNRVAEILSDQGPKTAFEVMQEMFSDLPVKYMFSGMSEAIGHLDLLEDEEQIETRDDGDVITYQLR